MRLRRSSAPILAALGVSLLFVIAGAPSAGAQAVHRKLTLRGPHLLATGVTVRLRGRGARPRHRVAIERRRRSGWRVVAGPRADRHGHYHATYVPRGKGGRIVLRARAGGRKHPLAISHRLRIRTRGVLLAAVGDINLGDGVRSYMAAHGRAYPWRSAGPVLRRADIAFGNLECAISNRGHPVPKEFNFRGSPGALRVAHRLAGLDVVNLANNHSGDYGVRAFRDTIRNVRRLGMVPVGAGANLARARRARIVTRLGLRIAFVGFSQILPTSYYARAHSPGTVYASPHNVRVAVRAASRRADVVIATFHWGIERDTHEDASQRSLARTALRAGATAVIGAHPHVLQPIRRFGHRLIAYSLGNFVFTTASAVTSRTGILYLRLTAHGIRRTRFRRATIVGGRPILR